MIEKEEDGCIVLVCDECKLERIITHKKTLGEAFALLNDYDWLGIRKCETFEFHLCCNKCLDEFSVTAEANQNVLSECLVKLKSGDFVVGVRDGDRFVDKNGNPLAVEKFCEYCVFAEEMHMLPISMLMDHIAFLENKDV